MLVLARVGSCTFLVLSTPLSEHCAQYLEAGGIGTRLAEGRSLMDGKTPRKPKQSLLQLLLVAPGPGQGLQLAPTQLQVQVTHACLC